ncbi:hypothetical protein B7C42_06049 [Nocardia cerradoensis]|uniref:Uncharacterized protein n=1 Tax=Nocardia cerradoensis TaxID=85688 RepID=A0A231GYL9_9NOCA|nr:hypothetical protein B7C42_06049 [Nocardia cerradoensis]
MPEAAESSPKSNHGCNAPARLFPIVRERLVTKALYWLNPCCNRLSVPRIARFTRYAAGAYSVSAAVFTRLAPIRSGTMYGGWNPDMAAAAAEAPNMTRLAPRIILVGSMVSAR